MAKKNIVSYHWICGQSAIFWRQFPEHQGRLKHKKYLPFYADVCLYDQLTGLHCYTNRNTNKSVFVSR